MEQQISANYKADIKIKVYRKCLLSLNGMPY